jgi:hypothetical protein
MKQQELEKEIQLLEGIMGEYELLLKAVSHRSSENYKGKMAKWKENAELKRGLKEFAIQSEDFQKRLVDLQLDNEKLRLENDELKRNVFDLTMAKDELWQEAYDTKEVLTAYNNYIQEANEENKYESGWMPVCIEEFEDNDMEFYTV